MAQPTWQSGASPGPILLFIIPVVILLKLGIGPIQMTFVDFFFFFNLCLGKTLNFAQCLGVKYGIGIRINLVLLLNFGIEFVFDQDYMQ